MHLEGGLYREGLLIRCIFCSQVDHWAGLKSGGAYK